MIKHWVKQADLCFQFSAASLALFMFCDWNDKVEDSVWVQDTESY